MANGANTAAGPGFHCFQSVVGGRTSNFERGGGGRGGGGGATPATTEVALFIGKKTNVSDSYRTAVTPVSSEFVPFFLLFLETTPFVFVLLLAPRP